MNKTAHSEYLPLESVVIKPVSTAFSSDSSISEQWKELNYLAKTDFEEAVTEYKAFESILDQQQTEILH